MIELPSVVSAWEAFHKTTQLNIPVTEAAYLELKALADYLLRHYTIDEEPHATLFEMVSGYMHAWELVNEPQLKDIEAEPHAVLAFMLEQHGISQI